MSDRTIQARQAVEHFKNASRRGDNPRPWPLIKWIERLADDIETKEG